MKHTKLQWLALGAATALIAAGSVSAMGHGGMMGMGKEMGMKMGMKSHSGAMNPFTASGVSAALAAKGLIAPTQEEMTAFHTKMQAQQAAMESLTDTQKAELEKIHSAHQKAVREYLRAQNIAVPTEAEIEKMETIKSVLKETMPAMGMNKMMQDQKPQMKQKGGKQQMKQHSR
jgi:hypothetical protein